MAKPSILVTYKLPAAAITPLEEVGEVEVYREGVLTHDELVRRVKGKQAVVVAALDKIASLNPRAVVASHKRPENDDNPKIIGETRQYIRDFDRLAATTTTAQELYDKMLELYPDRANPVSLWGSARAVKGRSFSPVG